MYGQGITAAAVGAELLSTCLRERVRDDGLAADFQTRLAKANTRPWLLATGEDYRYAEAEGPPARRVTRLMHRYLDRVIAVATRVPTVRRRLMDVLHLVRPPESLLHPAVLARAAITRLGIP